MIECFRYAREETWHKKVCLEEGSTSWSENGEDAYIRRLDVVFQKLR